LRLGAQSVWVRADDIVPASSARGARADGVTVTGLAVAVSRQPPADALRVGTRAAVDRLELELTVTPAAGPPVRLGALGVPAVHARFIGALPADRDLYMALAGRPPAREHEALAGGAE